MISVRISPDTADCKGCHNAADGQAGADHFRNDQHNDHAATAKFE